MKHIYSYKPPNRCNDAQFSGRRRTAWKIQMEKHIFENIQFTALFISPPFSSCFLSHLQARNPFVTLNVLKSVTPAVRNKPTQAVNLLPRVARLV